MTSSVVRINTTAVKGTALSPSDRVVLGPAGVHANRRFHFVDARGAMVNGKRVGELVRIRSDYDADANVLSLTFPDGRRVRERVTSGGETLTTDFYGRPVPGTVVDGPWASAVSEFAGAALRLVHIAAGVTGADVHPVTIISQATMEHVRRHADGPEARWEDRFRMMFEIDGIEPYEEDTWAERAVAIGEAVVRVVGPVPRCVVTTHDPGTGVRSFDTLGALRRARGARTQELSTPTAHLPDGGKFLLGVYAVVEKSGAVWRGCAARLV